MKESLSVYEEGKRLYTPEERARAWVEYDEAATEFNDLVQARRSAISETLWQSGTPVEVLFEIVHTELDRDKGIIELRAEMRELRRQWEIIDLRTPRTQEWAFRGESA